MPDIPAYSMDIRKKKVILGFKVVTANQNLFIDVVIFNKSNFNSRYRY